MDFSTPLLYYLKRICIPAHKVFPNEQRDPYFVFLHFISNPFQHESGVMVPSSRFIYFFFIKPVNSRQIKK